LGPPTAQDARDDAFNRAAIMGLIGAVEMLQSNAAQHSQREA